MAVVLAMSLVTGVSVAAAAPSPGDAMKASTADGSPKAGAADIWIVSKTRCLGTRNTRRVIRGLRKGRDIVTQGGLLTGIFGGLVGRIGTAIAGVTALELEGHARETARAYLKSRRRGVCLRLGIKPAFRNPPFKFGYEARAIKHYRCFPNLLKCIR